MPESQEHLRLKNLLREKLLQWYGASITEYYDEGHELDVYAVTAQGVSIYIEIIWYHNKSHFRDDLLILERSDANIKIVIVSPDILKDSALKRDFDKTAISQRKKGFQFCGFMINGQRILDDLEYVENELRQIFDFLINENNRESEDTQVYSFEVEAYDLIEKEANTERDIDEPLIELIIGPNTEPSRIFNPREDTTIVRIFESISEIIPRRKYFQCKTLRENAFIRIFNNGFFHYLVPFIKSRSQAYYLDYIFYQVLDFLLYAVRILKKKKVQSDFTVYIFLRNIRNIPVTFEDRFPRRHSWSIFPEDEDVILFQYIFNPSHDWESIQDILFALFRELCAEAGFVQISEENIKRRINTQLKETKALRTFYPDAGIMERLLDKVLFTDI